ncbi:MAG: PQQ-like beta-propeller repeat protein [Kiritimatiellae bacterium]|nr:PQQ-like beta-propeller repeat protein [Kiritimatiellia bacterium]
MMMRTMGSIFVLAAILAGSLSAEDVLRFRGENAQGKFNEPTLLKQWPEAGLEPKWSYTELGAGWGSVIKVGDRLYVSCIDAEDNQMEAVACLDLEGKKQWQTPIGNNWRQSFQAARTTPTYADGKLVILTGSGVIACLDAKEGKKLWGKNLAQIYGTKFGPWGMAESLVVKDGKAFVTVSGDKALAVALKLEDGAVAWETPSNHDRCAYVSPAFCEDQLILMTARYVTGVNPATGEVYWQEDYGAFARPSRSAGINCNPPVVKGNRFFVAAGYDQGGVMYELLPEKKGVKKVWSTKVLDPHHDGMVEVDGFLYGSNWINNNTGNWVCMNWETGEVVYEQPWERLGKGITVFADGMLYIYGEKRGTLGLLKPGKTFDVVSSFPFRLGTKEHWAHPVISDGILYMRRGNALAAYDIREKK